jgi:uncharacterized protein DUF5818
MRKIAIATAALALLFGATFASAKDRTFTGEVYDNMCAAAGSHAAMLKMSGMGDKDPNDPMAKKMCTTECVKKGGKYVLYNAATKTIYELDDQQKPAEFAGQKVKVTGTLNAATKTIHVVKIQAGS